jgi:hypothetical protein
MEKALRVRSGARRFAAVAAAFAAAAIMPSAGMGVAEIEEIHGDLPDIEARAVEAPTGAQRAQARELRAHVQWNRDGTPQTLYRARGYLSKAYRGVSAPAAARRWLKANRALFKLRSLRSLRLATVARVGRNGRAVTFREVIGGRDSFDGLATVGLARRGAGWRVVYVSSSLSGESHVTGHARLSATEALVRAARDVGHRISLVELSAAGRNGSWRLLRAARLSGVQSMRPIAIGTRQGAVPAYQTVVSNVEEDGATEAYSHVIDARSGRVLVRQSVVDHAADNPKWEVFPAYPHMGINQFPWNYPSADIRDLWCWSPDPGCQYLPSSSHGTNGVAWDVNARTNTPTFTTTGNNAKSAESWFSSFTPGPTFFQPTSPTRDYVYPWTNVWFETLCDPANFVVGSGNDISAAATNLFAGHNRMHDWSYVLGFTEARWNAQDYNFGRPTLENDPIDGMVQAGGVTGGYPTYSGRDNAFMATRPDGTRSFSGMFLWQPLSGSFYAPCVDGDFDMAVIAHEYGHMIENRMIGKGNRRMGSHAGMMGESFGDMNAMEYLNEYNFVPVGGENPYSVGAYVTGNDERAIRNYSMAFPTTGHFPEPGRYAHVDPLNFSDVGYDITGPQVHADGEIWSATNFDIRELLLGRYPGHGQNVQRECADGERPVTDCPGNRRWFQLYYDAMILMPVRPTFLDARDAILAADVMRFGGANQDLLWLAFARRGFGQNAQNTSSEDFEPRPDFESPVGGEATVVFNARALNEGGAPITNANIYVGHYERGVTPIADTNPATPGPYLDNVAGIVPDDSSAPNSGQRAYEFVANAPGYGHVRFRLNNLRAGETRNVTIHFPTNWASRHKGAIATGDGTRHNDLIDDTEGTNWESTGTPVQGRQVVVQLAGGAHRVHYAKVSALLQPGQNRFTALREFELYGCTGTPPNLDCRRILASGGDAFPGVPPRPVAPEMILRTWNTGGGQPVTHVLFRVLNNQCTGQPAFQGEQDNDPANTSTDCRIGTAPVLPPRGNDVRASEVQVFSDSPRVDGATHEE